MIERLAETMDVISPTKSRVMRYEFYVAHKEAAGRKSERAIEREESRRCRLVLSLKALWVLSPWKPSVKEIGESFYPYFYLSDQRFATHSTIRVVAKCGSYKLRYFYYKTLHYLNQ